MAKASDSSPGLASCDALSELLELLHEQLRRGGRDEDEQRSQRLVRNVERYRRLQAQFEACNNQNSDMNQEEEEEEAEVLYENTGLSFKWAQSIQGDLVPPPLPPRQPRPSAPPPPRRPPSLDSSINNQSSQSKPSQTPLMASNNNTPSVLQLNRAPRGSGEPQEVLPPSRTMTVASTSQLSALSKASSTLESELGSMSSSSLCSFVDEKPHFDLEALMSKVKPSELNALLEALSSTPSSCLQMLSSSASVFSHLVDVLHPKCYDHNDKCDDREDRARAIRTMRRIVSAQASAGRKGRKRLKILRLLEQLRMFTDLLKDSVIGVEQHREQLLRKEQGNKEDFALIGCVAVTVTASSNGQVICEYIHDSENSHSVCVKTFDRTLFLIPNAIKESLEDSNGVTITLDMQQVLSSLAKCSFYDAYNQHMLLLGAVNALADFILVERYVHFGLDDAFLPPVCADVRHSAVVSLANLAFGRVDVKSYLIHYDGFIETMKEHLGSNRMNVMLNTTHLVRNLTWKIDKESKKRLSESNIVPLMLSLAQLQYDKEKKTNLEGYTKALETLLSALWNLSAHSDHNKNEMCSGRNLPFLVAMLKHPCSEVASNACGIIRNLSPTIAKSQELRSILHSMECVPLLMSHLVSSSTQTVSNALNSLYHLSVNCAETQKMLHELRAESLIGSLTDSVDKSIRQHAEAILDNLGTLVDDDLDNTLFKMNNSVILQRRRQISGNFIQEEMDEEALFEVKPLRKRTDNTEFEGGSMKKPAQPLKLEMNPVKKQMFVKPNVHLHTSHHEFQLQQRHGQMSQSECNIGESNSKSNGLAPTALGSEQNASVTGALIKESFEFENHQSQLEHEIEEEDRPTDFSLRFFNDDEKNDEEDNVDNEVVDDTSVLPLTIDEGKLEEEDTEDTNLDQVKTFAAEGTPFAISTATSISDLREPQQRPQNFGHDIRNSKLTTLSGTLTPAGADRPRVYCTEGTPIDVGSRSQCLSPLLSHDEEENDEDNSEDQSNSGYNENDDEDEKVVTPPETNDDKRNVTAEKKIDIASTISKTVNTPMTKSVKFGKQLETPLIFSRQSSLESLNSCDSNSIHTGYSSAITLSRTTSRPLSPSELPDSPLESPTPSIGHREVEDARKTGSPVSEHVGGTKSDHVVDYEDSQGGQDEENDRVKVFNAGEETPSVGLLSSKTSIGKFEFDDDQLLNSDWMRNSMGDQLVEETVVQAATLAVDEPRGDGDKTNVLETEEMDSNHALTAVVSATPKRSNYEEEIYAESLIASFSQLGMPKKKVMSSSSRSSSGGRRSRASTSMLNKSNNEQILSPKANSTTGFVDDEEDNSDCFTDLVALGMPKKNKPKLNIAMRGSGDGIPTTKASVNRTGAAVSTISSHVNRPRAPKTSGTITPSNERDETLKDGQSKASPEEAEEEQAILDNLVQQGFPKSKHNKRVPKAMVAPISRRVTKATHEEKINRSHGISKTNACNRNLQPSSVTNASVNIGPTMPRNNDIAVEDLCSTKDESGLSASSVSLLSSTKLEEEQSTTPLTKAKQRLKEDLESFRAFRASASKLDISDENDVNNKFEQSQETSKRHDDDDRYRTRTIRKGDLPKSSNNDIDLENSPSPLSKISDRHQEDRFKTHVIRPEDVKTKNLNPMDMLVVTGDDDNDNEEGKISEDNKQIKKGPRILKPTMMITKEETKNNLAIRGRRRALYQSPSSSVPKANLIKESPQNRSPSLTKKKEHVNSKDSPKSKSALGTKPTVAPKPQKLFTPIRTPPTPRAANSRNSSPSTGGFIRDRDNSNTSSPRGSTRSNLSNLSNNSNTSNRLRRQGTFTKEPSPNAQGSNRSPKLRRDVVHPEQPKQRTNHRSASTQPKSNTTPTATPPRTPTTRVRKVSTSPKTASTTPPKATSSIPPTTTSSTTQKTTLDPSETTPPRTTPKTASSSTSSLRSGSRPKAVTNRLANLWRVKRDRKANSTSFLGRNIPESELALLKEHAEQKELINKHKKNSIGSSESERLSMSDQPFVTGHKSRLSLRLGRLRNAKKGLASPEPKDSIYVDTEKSETTENKGALKNDDNVQNEHIGESKDDLHTDLRKDVVSASQVLSERRASTLSRLSTNKAVRRNDSYMTSMGRRSDLTRKKENKKKDNEGASTATPV